MSTVHLIYASTTGNTETVMEKIAELLTAAGITTELHRSETTNFDIIQNNDTFILGCSTWGHGIINPFFDELLEQIGEGDMSGKKAAFVGMGDSKYEPIYFNKGIDILHEAFTKAGGTEINKALKIDGDPYPVLDTKVTDWANKLITALKDASPPA